MLANSRLYATGARESDASEPQLRRSIWPEGALPQRAMIVTRRFSSRRIIVVQSRAMAAAECNYASRFTAAPERCAASNCRGQEPGHATMYESFFHLSKRPFAATANVQQYYPRASSKPRDARSCMHRAGRRDRRPDRRLGHGQDDRLPDAAERVRGRVRRRHARHDAHGYAALFAASDPVRARPSLSQYARR